MDLAEALSTGLHESSWVSAKSMSSSWNIGRVPAPACCMMGSPPKSSGNTGVGCLSATWRAMASCGVVRFTKTLWAPSDRAKSYKNKENVAFIMCIQASGVGIGEGGGGGGTPNISRGGPIFWEEGLTPHNIIACMQCCIKLAFKVSPSPPPPPPPPPLPL